MFTERTCNVMRGHDFTDKWYHLVQNKQSAIIAHNTIKFNITRYHWISIYLNVSNYTRILCMFARPVISFWFKQHQAVNFIQIFYSHLLPSIQNTIVFICCSCYRSTRIVFFFLLISVCVSVIQLVPLMDTILVFICLIFVARFMCVDAVIGFSFFDRLYFRSKHVLPHTEPYLFEHIDEIIFWFFFVIFLRTNYHES